MSSLRSDVQVVRETLEGTLAPAVATATLFEALDRWGRGIPENSQQVIELVRGPLATLLETRLGQDAARTVIAAVEERLGAAQPPQPDLDLDVDVSDEVGSFDDDDQRTTQLSAVPHPVSVLVVSSSEIFAQRLLTVLGEDRVYPHTVSDEAALRHAMFSALPLIAVVDTTRPPAIKPPQLAAALKSVPDQTVAILWAAETDYGREARVRIEQSGHDIVCLDRKEGFEPLLDLVLSRFKQHLSTKPPPEM